MLTQSYIDRAINRLFGKRIRSELDDKIINSSMKSKTCRKSGLIDPIEFSKVPLFIYRRTPQYNYRNTLNEPLITSENL